MDEWSRFDEIAAGRGMYLIDRRGRRLLDGVASMWCNVWGHSRPELVRAISRQASRLQHAPLFNLTHRPAEELAGRLAAMSPGMERVFFSDNGSTAVESAVKIAIQYWSNSGERKKSGVAALKGGYHGDTFGAMSVGYVPEFFSAYRPKLFKTARLRAPDSYRRRAGQSTRDDAAQSVAAIEAHLAAHAGTTACLVMESGVQMAGGVRIYPRGFQRQVSRLCARHGALLVLDEVAAGFGRLGHMAEYAAQGARPDIVVYGKMMTGGYATMGATLASKKVYGAFSGSFAECRHLFHGHTYTGNPIAAAVANASMRLYKKEGLLAKSRRVSAAFAEHAGEFSEISLVGDVRHSGMVMGIELVSDRKSKRPLACSRASINKTVFEAGRKNGVYLRTLGNIVMVVPPLAITRPVLDDLLRRTASAIRDAEPRLRAGA